MLFYCITAWGPTILQSKGFTVEQAAAAATFLQVASLPITLASPLLTRRFSPVKMLVLLNTLYVAGGVLYYLSDDLRVIYLAMLLMAQGLGSSFGFCLMFFSLRTRDAVQASTLSGIAQCGGYVLAAVGPVLMGRLADLTGAWKAPLLFLGAVLALMYVSSLLSAREGHILPE
jgi:CP family cyanate transporter-like MFS transporter